MSGQVQITFAIKELFFDRPAIQKALRRANRTNLGKAAAFVRRVARNSLRKPGKRGLKNAIQKRDLRGRFLTKRSSYVSPAGSPPFRRTDPGLQTIFYAFDPRAESAIVGPVLLNGTKRLSSKTGPELHEFGGTAVLKVPERATKQRPRRVRVVTARYPRRPFMGPALEKSANKFPDLWRNSVRS